ncbi:MAG: hypothetical protein AB1609_18015 [Bacillota bacterium]
MRRLLPHIQARHLSSQRFWDHMERLEREHILEIERTLVEHMVREFQLDLRAVVYDTTNFISYIDTANAAELPQRGASKAKGFDLKQVGLALLVASDFHVPLILDKGNNSESNQHKLSGSGYHFVGSLVPSHHPELLRVPKSHYQPLRAPEPGTRPAGPKRRSSDGLPELHFELDQEALHQLARERFGKTILFTDQHDWSNERILAA